MTTQQASNLHPYVYNINIVDPKKYPNIDELSLTTQSYTNFAIANDYNIYTVSITDTTLSIIRLQRQDYHQHYFAQTVAVTKYNAPVTIPVNTGISHAPYLEYSDLYNKLYLLYNNGSNTTIINQYTVEATGTRGLTLEWSNSIIGIAIDTERKYSGVVFSDILLYTYIYLPISGSISIYQTIKATGITTSLKSITGLSTGLSCVNMSLSYDYLNFYINTLSDKLYVLIADISATNGPAMSNVLISDQLNIVSPGITMLAEDVYCLIYGFNLDDKNRLYITNINGRVNSDGDVNGLDMPYKYNLDKLSTYDEALDETQLNMTIAHTVNIYSRQFSYFAYVTVTDQIRIVKVYHQRIVNSVIEKYTPLILWSTRLGAINYYYGSGTSAGGIHLVTDSLGKVYVFIRNGDTGLVKMWVIEEFPLDLGHTAGTITQPIDTIADLLSTLRTEYTIMNPVMYNFKISGYPNVDDVIISSITESGLNVTIQFEYIDYDMLVLYPSIRQDIQDAIIASFRTLYSDSNIDIINVGTGTIPDGEHTHIRFTMLKGTLLKPCVVRGTNVIVCENDGRNIKNIPIEQITEGSYIINQIGSPVKVLKHLNSKIWCQKHNAPYIIPVNFFGEHRPYEQLLISGDHGILVSKAGGKVNIDYARSINYLKQIQKEQEVEYHHLLLDNHDKNFFIANGLEVDSLHPGMYFM